MGACASRRSASDRERTPETSGGSQGRNPSVSMSFLKKYSFATVNPAFADFETRTPEEEEATSKLRALAQESFGVGEPWRHQEDPNETPATTSSSSEPPKVSDEGCSIIRSSGNEIEEIIETFSDHHLAIQELAEEEEIEISIPANNFRIHSSSNNRKNRVNPVKISEEKLVMSSSCMPNYSLGVIVNPEVRKSTKAPRL